MAGIEFPPQDLTGYATNAGLLNQYQSITGNTSAGQQDMFNDVMQIGNKAKTAKAAAVTNSTGVFTMNYPAGFWKAEPSINVAPISATGGNGQLTFKVSKMQVSNAWTVTVTFAMLPATVTVVVAGSTSLWVNPGIVTFDYQAFEQTA
jgi:hypothetical protein